MSHRLSTERPAAASAGALATCVGAPMMRSDVASAMRFSAGAPVCARMLFA